MSDSITTNDDEVEPHDKLTGEELIEDLYGGGEVVEVLRPLTGLQVAYIRRARRQEHLPWDSLPKAIRAHYDEQLAAWDAHIAEAESEGAEQ